MRKPFGLLMDWVAAIPADSTTTLGELSREWGEPVERIMDAIDAVKVCTGQPSYLGLDEDLRPPPCPRPGCVVPFFHMHGDGPAVDPGPGAS